VRELTPVINIHLSPAAHGLLSTVIFSFSRVLSILLEFCLHRASATPTASMVGFAFGAVGSKKADVEVAQAEAPEFQKVNWWKDGNLRKLYFYCSVLLVASATYVLCKTSNRFECR